MTAIESLPRYAEAERVAKAHGGNLRDMLSAYVAGVADMGDMSDGFERDSEGYPMLHVNREAPGIIKPVAYRSDGVGLYARGAFADGDE
ncbi:hypothetical protein [Bifidobacterium bifidum]|uniref:hypothetical protein n=1 Tax=Bifidobacterium bifidum TaxID=1681 RepID=UPI003D06F8D4